MMKKSNTDNMISRKLKMRYENMSLSELEKEAYLNENNLALVIYNMLIDGLHLKEEMKDYADEQYEYGYRDGECEGFKNGYATAKRELHHNL